MNRIKLPLNGIKTHPLSEHALGVLASIEHDGPMPRTEINPGVANRLLREDLVESVMLPSPYNVDLGKPRQHLRITDAGRERLP